MTKINGSLNAHSYMSLRKLVSIALLLLVVATISACKAESSLEITLQDRASGSLVFALKVDEEAASLIRDDKYGNSTFKDVFQTEQLKKAGFKISIDENTNGDPSTFILKTNFKGEDDLRAVLSVLADKKVVDAVLNTETTFTKETTDLKLKIDLSKLRDHYLDEDLKPSIEAAKLKWEEYKALINEAFASVSFSVKLKGDKEVIEAIDSQTSKETILNASKSSFRSELVFSILAGFICLMIGSVMFWRFCRRPQLLSSENDSLKGSDGEVRASGKN